MLKYGNIMFGRKEFKARIKQKDFSHCLNILFMYRYHDFNALVFDKNVVVNRHNDQHIYYI